ncbi:hypothetical protein AKO1_005428, partial [Acrasis kona]
MSVEGYVCPFAILNNERSEKCRFVYMDLKELNMHKLVCPFILFHSWERGYHKKLNLTLNSNQIPSSTSDNTVASKKKNKIATPLHLSTNDIRANNVILNNNNADAIDRYRENDKMFIAGDRDLLVPRSTTSISYKGIEMPHMNAPSTGIYKRIMALLNKYQIPTTLCNQFDRETMLSKSEAIETIHRLLHNPNNVDYRLDNNQVLHSKKVYNILSLFTAWNIHVFFRDKASKEYQPALTCYPNRAKEDASEEVKNLFEEWITKCKIESNHKEDYNFTYDTFISTVGCFTDAQYNPLTAYTVSRMRAGCKLFIQWPTSIENLEKFIGMPASIYNTNNKYKWCFENLEGRPTAILYRAGDQVTIDANTIHCVFTLQNSILAGNMFLDHKLSFVDVICQLRKIQGIYVRPGTYQHQVFKTDIKDTAKIWVDHGGFSEEQINLLKN